MCRIFRLEKMGKKDRVKPVKIRDRLKPVLLVVLDGDRSSGSLYLFSK